MGDGRSHAEQLARAKVICHYCGYRAVDHRRTTGEPTVPDICERTINTVLIEDGPELQIKAVIDNNVKVRLFEGGPMVDLGCDAPTLLASGLEALGDLAKKTPGYVFSPILAHALGKIRKARGED
jgi:hypothetical protein